MKKLIGWIMFIALYPAAMCFAASISGEWMPMLVANGLLWYMILAAYLMGCFKDKKPPTQ